MEWIYNPWIVGIGGGVLSGILVAIVSRLLLSRRDRREYAQKLLSANREVVYAIRPGISEGHIPEPHVVEALVRATARKYSIDKADLYDPAQVGEELTKEIMDSSFISAKTKQDYCNQLKCYHPQSEKASKAIEIAAKFLASTKTGFSEYRSRMVTTMSIMLGVMTTLMSAVFVFSEAFDSGSLGAKSESVKFLWPAIIAITTIAMATVFPLLRTQLHRTKRKDTLDGKTRTDGIASTATAGPVPSADEN